MSHNTRFARRLGRDIVISALLYLLPPVSLFAFYHLQGLAPWHDPSIASGQIGLIARHPQLLPILQSFYSWGIPGLAVLVGGLEFLLGYYGKEWTRNERTLDFTCLVVSRTVITAVLAYFGQRVFPVVIPSLKDVFAWVPFGWGCAIIIVADDLTQYWYHRLHHQIRFLWRFHRTHHSAPYMGAVMTNRQNIIYSVLFSQLYLTAILSYLGLGLPALFVGTAKAIIVYAAHSNIAWDKPLYRYRALHPVAWVLERIVSTPATHHAHHADTTNDGIGYYKGNFGNMLFLWDVIFGTAKITRKFPSRYGIKHYQREEWYVQFLWPLFKSKRPGSELSSDSEATRKSHLQANEETIAETPGAR
jgi:sterol desaturase/sphingolipid hydroxylase (fatty acid hydroxylase superfamily)